MKKRIFSMEEKMKKFLAVVMVVAMMASFATVAFAEEAQGPSPLASYDFTKDLKDHSGNNIGDVVLDDEPMKPDENDPSKEVEARSDAERLAGHSGRATLGEKGITMKNGFFKLPEDMFAKAAGDITGLTVSITYTKEADYGWGSTWSEHLFAFSDQWMTEELKNDDGTMNYDGRANSFFATRNGNVATSKTPYGTDGSWMDGTLGEGYGNDGKFANVTVTFDFATNVASIYLDGELKKTSEDNAEVKAVLTADIVKSFKYAVVGLPVGGDWGMWSFMTVANLNVYTSALTADQVKTVATNGIGTLNDAPATPPTPAPATGFATVAIALAAVGSGAYVVSKKRH